MNCNTVSELLAAAVLGDLNRHEKREVHAHLAVCDRCLDQEAEFHETMHLLRAHGEVEPGEDFHTSVMTRVENTVGKPFTAPPPRARVGLLTRTLLTAAATALVVVGLQTALESWQQGSAPSPAGAPVITGVTLAGQTDQALPSLLDGTLFDRQRNNPKAVRDMKPFRRRSDTSRPLDL
jgi:anti-sigma factor RsiW